MIDDNITCLPTNGVALEEARHAIDSVEALKQKALDRKVEVASGNTPHASSASTEGTSVDSHPENPEDDHKAPFIDNKISYFLSAVKGVL